MERFREYRTRKGFAAERGWEGGGGSIAGLEGISRPGERLRGKPLLPTSALSENGLETMFLDTVPDRPIKDTKTERRFSPPLLLIKEHENLHHGLWNGHYLTYKHEIVGLAAPKTDLHHLAAIEAWLEREDRQSTRLNSSH